MIVHIYSMCWNEGAMLPYYLTHYEPFVDNFFIYDDSSTDDSLKVLRNHPKVVLGKFDRQADSFVESAKIFYNTIWKNSRGVADWVALCNIDEHYYRPNLRDYLKRCKAEGITAIPARGYQMISDEFPEFDGLLCDNIDTGMRWGKMDKLSFFDPDAINPKFAGGRHKCFPEGNVKFPKRITMKLLHYKYLGLEYVITRHVELKSGLTNRDVKNLWGKQYCWSKEETEAEFLRIKAGSTRIPLKIGNRFTNFCFDKWHKSRRRMSER